MPATEVLVDGKRIGETPIEASRDSGTVTVWLRNQTLGIEHRARVTLRPGERSLVSKVFGKGTLKVSVEPWAEVILDGRSLGETPVSPQRLWEGEHVLTLRNARLAKRETLRVRIRSGETTLVQRSWK
jgi:serine/threonine-protein kinase